MDTPSFHSLLVRALSFLGIVAAALAVAVHVVNGLISLLEYLISVFPA